MSVKELTDLTVTDLFREYKRSFVDYWERHDEEVKAFREVRRRTRPMSCFNNTQSIERIVYAVLSHLNDQWRIKTLKEFTQNY